MKNDSVAIGIIGAGIMGERLLNAILQQDPAVVRACGLWLSKPLATSSAPLSLPRPEVRAKHAPYPLDLICS